MASHPSRRAGAGIQRGIRPGSALILGGASRSRARLLRYSSRRDRRRRREAKRKCRPHGGVSAGREFAPVRFDDGPANRKTHPHSIGFGRKERLKDSLRRLESTAAVANLDDHGLLSGGARAEDELLWASYHFCQRIDGILCQVRKHLLNLNSVRLYRL